MLLTRFLASGHRHQHLGLEWAAEGCGYTHTCRRDCEAERPQKTRIRQIHYLRWTDVHWRFVHGMSSSVSGGFCPDSHVRHTERSLFGVARGPSLRFLSFCSPQNSVRNIFISLGIRQGLAENDHLQLSDSQRSHWDSSPHGRSSTPSCRYTSSSP